MMATVRPRRPSVLRVFLAGEAAGGIVLIAAAALAILLANGPWAAAFAHILHAPLPLQASAKLGPWTAHLFVNDALMAIFFFLVGLEIKRELVDGRLSSWERRRLPVVAAIAGMAAPAAIFVATVAGRGGGLVAGWAIPAATDIAFAVGVLALLGKRVPASLKLFLVAVAIVDDMGAVAIIALFYTPAIAAPWLGAALAIWALMWMCNRRRVIALWPYVLLAILLWACVLQSGVHATVAGVMAAVTVPFVPSPAAPDAVDSPLHRLEHGIHPWSAFLIVPLFGLANAGVSLAGMSPALLLAPLPLGIMLGLFVGKQIGIFAAVRLAVAAGIADRPSGASWWQVYGVAALCGIGFTMSLFIGALAFPGSDPVSQSLREEAKLGVLAGSLLSALTGYLILRFAPRRAVT